MQEVGLQLVNNRIGKTAKMMTKTNYRMHNKKNQC